MSIRNNWTVRDYDEAYSDQWDEVPTTVKECQEKMEEEIFHSYDTEYIKECIENES